MQGGLSYLQKQVSERMCHVQKQVSQRMCHVQKQAVAAQGMWPKREGESVQKQAVSLGAERMRPPRQPRWSRSSPRPVDTLVRTTFPPG